MNCLLMTLRHFLPTTALSAGLLLVGTFISPSVDAADTEPNNTFETRAVTELDSAAISIEAELEQKFDPATSDYSFPETLNPGEASSFQLDDLPASEPFYAWIDNGLEGPDTVIGIFDENNTLINSDDDSSPIGNGVASGLGGTVNPDGTVRLAVTGFPDFDFASLASESGDTHQESGPYEVRVTLGIEAPQGDVDYYSIPNLTPGAEFTIEITRAEFDTILVWLDDAGSVVYIDDDGGNELLSRLRGFVPLSGTVNFAVSAFGDLEFSGTHIESGAYTLAVELSD